MKWSEQVWQLAGPIYRSILSHPFIIELANGTLARERFLFYLNQDAILSAAIAFLRTLLFQTAAIFVLPLFLGLDGIWLAVTAAEVLTLAVTVLFLLTQRRRYGYGG